MTPDLTPHQRRVLLGILAVFSDRIERVAVFGSRATGAARPSSDIDLVLYGNIDAKLERRLSSLFEDSPLPVRVDVVAYHSLTHAPLKAHIDSVALTLFTQKDLARAHFTEA